MLIAPATLRILCSIYCRMAERGVEAVQDRDLTELTRDAFVKVAEYLNGELQGNHLEIDTKFND